MRKYPVLFPHIPKTAGTSFRKAVEASIGVSACCYDYSPSASETSGLVLDCIYKKQDVFSFSNAFKKQGYQFLAGHFPVTKYVHHFGIRNTVVFLRDPLQRIHSEYLHFVQHYGYKNDFAAFFREKRFINRQSTFLGGISLSALGFIGITEYYSNSIDTINKVYGLALEKLMLNTGRDKHTDDYVFEPEIARELTALNSKDIALFNQASGIFAVRNHLTQAGLPYVHANLQQGQNNRIAGWAWWDSSDDPVHLQIHVDGRQVGEAVAKHLQPNLLRFSPPRRGYVGFNLTLPDPLPEGAKIHAIASATGQRIDPLRTN